MKIIVFTEGTILMHKNAQGLKRDEISKQVREQEPSTRLFSSYIPIGYAVDKLRTWNTQDIEIIYLTSRTKPHEIEQIRNVLRRYDFPEGQLLFRRLGEQYKDIAERVIPDVLVEDDCESIGGIGKMTITHVNPELRKKILSVSVPEFGGIDHLPDRIETLLEYAQ